MTTDSPESVVDHRPGGVTFVVVLGYIASIFMILDGLLVILGADETGLQSKSGSTHDELIWIGIIMMVLGVIGVLLTGALARGSRVVRVLFAIWVALQIAGGLNTMLHDNGETAAAGTVPVVLGIIILYLLFNTRAHAFFEGD